MSKLQTTGDTPIQKRIELQRSASFRGIYVPKIGPHESLELYRLLNGRMACVDPSIQVLEK